MYEEHGCVNLSLPSDISVSIDVIVLDGLKGSVVYPQLLKRRELKKEN